MSRIDPLEIAEATPEQAKLLDRAGLSSGTVPNFLRTLAHAPAALGAYLAQSDALAEGRLDDALAQQIALAVSGANGCDYCASAHSGLASEAGVSSEDLARSLHGESTGARAAAVLGFVRQVVTSRGRVGDNDLRALYETGLSVGEVVEVLSHIGLNLFTNYFNQVAQTEIDFPSVCTFDARINA